MNEPLFNGKQGITNEKVIEKMKYFMDSANKGMELFESDRKKSLRMGKLIRKELNDEYKNNSLTRINNFYKDHELFSGFYQPAVHEALVSVTGSLSYNKLFGFLYDVWDYMNYYIPSRYDK